MELIASKKDSSAWYYFVGIEGALGTGFADGCSFLNAELQGGGGGVQATQDGRRVVPKQHVACATDVRCARYTSNVMKL
jgi:hypothetical protein